MSLSTEVVCVDKHKPTTIIDLNYDTLQHIALNLDPVSLVSFSLSCVTFRCDVLESHEAKHSRTSGLFGILGIPNEVKGVGICVEAIRCDLRDLFDYWSKRVFVYPDWNPRKMFEYAGSSSSPLEWIGKIFSFIFSKPILAQEYDSHGHTSFVKGIISTNDVARYESLAASLRIEHPKDIRDLFLAALETNSFRMAEYLATHLSELWPDTRDGSTFLSSIALKIACEATPEALQWFLDGLYTRLETLPRDVDIFRMKSGRLEIIIHNLISPAHAKVCFSHPLFLDIPDGMMISYFNQVYSRKIILEILILRPALSPYLCHMLLYNAQDLEPDVEDYLKKMSPREIHKILRHNHDFSTLSMQAILKMFPLEDVEWVYDVIDSMAETSDFVNIVRVCVISIPKTSKAKLLELLSKKYSEYIPFLIGEDIFPDDEIVAVVRKMKQKSK